MRIRNKIVSLQSKKDNRNGNNIEEKGYTKIGNELNGQGFEVESEDLNLNWSSSTY